MDAAEHLRLLRIFHFAMATVMLALLAGALVVAFASARWWPSLLIGSIGVALGVTHLLAGVLLPQRPGRIVSIVAAGLSLPSIPLGTAFGVYALLIHFKFLPEAQA